MIMDEITSALEARTAFVDSWLKQRINEINNMGKNGNDEYTLFIPTDKVSSWPWQELIDNVGTKRTVVITDNTSGGSPMYVNSGKQIKFTIPIG